jgi:dTDP-4-dehydrorhamnose 3,5-epimerase
MNIIKTTIQDVILLEPNVFEDERGYFLESYNKRVMSEAGICVDFVQDNHSRSKRNVLRGLHYQIQRPQGKLVRVISGEVFDVAVDLRKSAPTFGRWAGMYLSEKNKRMAWIPQGFAHGFLVLSDFADLIYKTTEYYAHEHERTILWSDPDISIEWPLHEEPILAGKDAAALMLKAAEIYN